MKPFRPGRAVGLALLIGCAGALAPVPAHAQQPEPTEQRIGDDGGGFVRIQGRDGATEEQAPTPGAEVLLNLREEMRRFIQSVSRFARARKPQFIVLVQDGLELLVKRDDVEETRVSPARTYMRSIDGVLAQGMFYAANTPGRPPPPDRQNGLLSRVEFARKNGLKVFTLDFGEGREVIDGAREQASKRGFISLVSNREFLDISELPSYPARPPAENPNSIIAINDVKNFAIITNSQRYGREDQFAMQMHANNFDMLIVDVYHGRSPLSRRAVETLKFKKIGARRLVLALMDIGTAASYAYYWRDGWREGAPAFINAPVRGDPDRYNVEFWRPGWQQLMSGDTNSYIYGLIAQGFDGVVLTGTEAYKFFEGGGEEEAEEGN